MLNTQILGYTHLKTPIEIKQLTKGPKNILFIGGVHGDEPEGFGLIERFIEQSPWQKAEGKHSLWVIPRLNPDGCTKNERTNSKGVDLNRNMPTRDWTPEIRAPRYNPGPNPASELETLALMEFIDKHKPVGILSAHSWEPMINYNGPAKEWAEFISTFNKYRISDDIGYPTPGSLGTWAGWERNIPTITLEVERGLKPADVWQVHSEAIFQALNFWLG